MTLLLLVFLGGVLTILSPCILPVLPFVFARSDGKFLSNGLPLLAGMAVTFTAIASLAAVGGAWAVRVNQYGRGVALVLLALFALTLLSRGLADRMSRPFVALGNRLTQRAAAGDSPSGALHSLLLGAATGLLWAPCAGPILGLVLTGAAISGPNARTTLLLFAYAAGACTSLAVVLLAGGRIFAALKRSLGAGEWLRRGLGVAVLVAVAAIILGWDRGSLTQLSLAGTTRWEESLLGGLRSGGAASAATPIPGAAKDSLPIEGRMPSLDGATSWINSMPLKTAELRGKVVLVDFWTYSCINCLRALPYVNGWYDKYKHDGLIVIGVHAPEFAFEKEPSNVQRAVADLHITYPVALDNGYAIWQAFNNQFWPAHYFIDAEGRIRAHHFGEGNYEESEQIIRQLLAEAGHTNLPPAGMSTRADGVLAPADLANDQSPETYVGYGRARNFQSSGGFEQDRVKTYSSPVYLGLNQWGLQGPWVVDTEKAVAAAAGAKIVFRFLARDLHLVMGPGSDGRPVRFRVLLDGEPPGANHGTDIDAAGEGTIRGQRLYQLIRQSAAVGEHSFSIEFLDAGVQAYSFTFG